MQSGGADETIKEGRETAVTREANRSASSRTERQAHNAAEWSVCGELCACGVLVQRGGQHLNRCSRRALDLPVRESEVE